MTYLVSLIIALLFALWGYNIGKTRQAGPIVGGLLGFFLTFIGIIIIYVLPKSGV